MKTIHSTRSIVILAAGVLFAISLAAQPPSKQGEREKTLTGVVSDNMCGRTHMAKDKTAAECTRLCVKQGSKYALVLGPKVYTLEGHTRVRSDLASGTYKSALHSLCV